MVENRERWITPLTHAHLHAKRVPTHQAVRLRSMDSLSFLNKLYKGNEKYVCAASCHHQHTSTRTQTNNAHLLLRLCFFLFFFDCTHKHTYMPSSVAHSYPHTYKRSRRNRICNAFVTSLLPPRRFASLTSMFAGNDRAKHSNKMTISRFYARAPATPTNSPPCCRTCRWHTLSEPFSQSISSFKCYIANINLPLATFTTIKNIFRYFPSFFRRSWPLRNFKHGNEGTRTGQGRCDWDGIKTAKPRIKKCRSVA